MPAGIKPTARRIQEIKQVTGKGGADMKKQGSTKKPVAKKKNTKKGY